MLVKVIYFLSQTRSSNITDDLAIPFGSRAC